jgi:hypothetical protein
MSGTESGGGNATEMPNAASPRTVQELPVPFKVFAAAHSPRRVPFMKNGRQVIFKGRPVYAMSAGSPLQIWLKLLKMNHGTERHTMADWEGLIQEYLNKPAHASDPKMGVS